jgi:hypothetical protein
VYDEQKREPKPGKSMCLYCGWSGTPDYTNLLDVHGAPALLVASKVCRRCGMRPTVQIGEQKPPLPVLVVAAFRDANLTREELDALADAIRDAADNMSPRQLAEQVPAASKIVTVASKAGAHWLDLLTAVLMAVSLYVMHADAERAHRDAGRAHADAERAHHDAEEAHDDAIKARRSTGELTDEDMRKIAQGVADAIKP